MKGGKNKNIVEVEGYSLSEDPTRYEFVSKRCVCLFSEGN